MRVLALATMVSLAACGARTPAEPVSPDVALCRAEARDSPEWRRVQQSYFYDNPESVSRVEREQRALEARLVPECLRRRGVIGQGGVEAPRQ